MKMAIENATDLPVHWLGRPEFHIIHLVALVSCGISIFCSCITIAFLFITERRSKRRSFYRWTTGERLVVYLAFFDLGFSCSHTLDHAYIYATFNHPPMALCVTFAFIIVQFIIGQSLVVLFTALSAYLLVIHQRKVKLGRYDWKLMLYALGIPTVFCAFGVIFNYIGPGGTWCYMAMGSKLGKIMNQAGACFMVTLCFVCSFCYVIIWGRMRRSGPSDDTEADLERKHRYHRSARVMLLFVIAYAAQWWPYTVYAMWAMFGQPHVWVIVIAVLFCNMGSLFNGFAYTFIRRTYLKRGFQRASLRKYTSNLTTMDYVPLN